MRQGKNSAPYSLHWVPSSVLESLWKSACRESGLADARRGGTWGVFTLGPYLSKQARTEPNLDHLQSDYADLQVYVTLCQL